MLSSTRPRCAQPKRPPRRHFTPLLETLEHRLAPATFTVLNTLDSGAGSLRQAIIDANATASSSAGPDVIEFNLSPGVQTIHVAGGLPIISDAVVINGATGAGGVPLIELRGASAGAWDILFISANDCLV